jgi:hypothetical protein
VYEFNLAQDDLRYGQFSIIMNPYRLNNVLGKRRPVDEASIAEGALAAFPRGDLQHVLGVVHM